MSDSYGKALNIEIFGESHGAAVGAVINGIAAGVKIDEAHIAAAMDKRRAVGAISTARKEPDIVRILSGVYNGHSTGNAICLVIDNTNTKSADYDKTLSLLRPSHADYTSLIKYSGYADMRGGGHFSGRLTAPIVAVGSIFTDMLNQYGIKIGTHLARCAGIKDDAFAFFEADIAKQIEKLNSLSFAAISDDKALQMQDKIKLAAADGDSVGGVLETAIIGNVSGIGEPFFSSLESELSQLLFSIPAVKGIEFGSGFALSDMRGSEANDAFCMQNNDIVTKTNHNGGILGGIASGVPIILRTAIKPTPSIYKEQSTVDYTNRADAKLAIAGRHDPCVAHRARIVQDSMCAIALSELLTRAYGAKWQEG